MSESKPIKAKPHFYACCLRPLQEIAKEMGYNLVIHGSMNRDMDLVAIPWIDNPKPEVELIKAFDMYLRGVCYDDGCEERGYMFSVLPGGRKNYVINLNRGGQWNNYTDEQWYLDISITPLPSINNNSYQKASNDEIRKAFESTPKHGKPYGTTDGYINTLRANLKHEGLIIVKQLN